jgi:hypothetical protein
VWTHHGESVR